MGERMSGKKKPGVRKRWGHVEHPYHRGDDWRYDGKYLGNCTLDNVDDLVSEEKPYTYESDYYIMTCLADLPKPKYRKE